MRFLRRLFAGVRAMVYRHRDDADLDDELRAYLDTAIEAKIARGATLADATRAARLELGSTPAIRDRVRDVGWEASIADLWADVADAARGLRWSPAFTVAVVLTLALGIGVNVGMFTLLDVILLRPLSLPAPDELIVLYERGPEAQPDAVGGTGRWLRFSYPRYRLLQQALGTHGTLAVMSAIFDAKGRTQGAAQDQRLNAQLVSGNYFETLGVQPLRGRLLKPDDERPNAAPAVAISAGLWRRTFGAADTVIGQPLVVNGTVVATIVGITPENFVGAWADRNPEIWLPITLQSAIGYKNESSSYTPVDLARPWLGQEISWLRVIGRVPADQRQLAEELLRSTNQHALADLTSSMDARQRASMMEQTLVIEPFARGFSGLRAEYSQLILALMLLVSLLLVLTCANIAGLFLVRAGQRAREVAIRVALGATAVRIARRCLAESLLLAAAGGAAGYLLGMWVKTSLAIRIMGTARGIPAGISANWRLIAFATGLSFATAIVFGLAPVIHSLRLGRMASNTLNQRTGHGSRLRGLQPVVVLQIALSVVIVFSAALLGRTLINLSRVDPGYDPDHLVGAYFSVAAGGYSTADAPAVRDRLIGAAASVPGVVSSAVSACGLLANCSYSAPIRVHGVPEPITVQLNWVGPGYFSTIGRPVIRGREFTEADRRGARVAVISESFANRYFEGRESIGRQLGFDQLDTTIVGVVRDARSRRIRDAPVPMVFALVNQLPPSRFHFAPGTLEIRVAGDPASMIAVVRDALRRAEPHVGVEVESIPERLHLQFERERAVASLASGFAALALLLASIGLYGVLADAVGRRTKEIGVRMALGADRIQVLRLVIRQGVLLTALGLATGLVVAPSLTRFLQGVLFEVTAFDPSIFLAVALMLIVIGALACYLPARRATRVDPVIALRAE